MLVNVESSNSVDGVAGKDSSDRTVRVLLGRFRDNGGNVTVRFDNIRASDNTVLVACDRISNSGPNPSGPPERVWENEHTIENNTLTVALNDFRAFDAYLLTVTGADITRTRLIAANAAAPGPGLRLSAARDPAGGCSITVCGAGILPGVTGISLLDSRGRRVGQTGEIRRENGNAVFSIGEVNRATAPAVYFIQFFGPDNSVKAPSGRILVSE
jgi:hypothetical protein